MLTNYNDEIEINIRALAIYLKRRLWIIIVATVFWGIFSYLAGNVLVRPMYESAARIAIVKNLEMATDVSVQTENNQLTDYYMEIISCGPVVSRVIEECGLDISYEQLAKNMKVYRTSGGNMLNVYVKYKNPEMAKQIVESLCGSALEYMKEIIGEGELLVIEEAYISYEQLDRNLKQWGAYGAFTSFGLTLAIIVLCFLMDGSLKTAEDVVNCLGLEVLTEIPANKQKKGRGEYKDIYRQARANIEYRDAELCVIGIVSCDSNDVKRNVAYELARSFAQNNKKVLLIDTNLWISGEKRKRAKEKDIKCIVDYLRGTCTISEVIVATEMMNLQLIFGGNLSGDSAELLDSEKFRALLKAAGKAYDKVIVDASSLGSFIDGALVVRQCDQAVLVIRKEKTKCRLAKEFIEQVEKIGGKILGTVLCND